MPFKRRFRDKYAGSSPENASVVRTLFDLFVCVAFFFVFVIVSLRGCVSRYVCRLVGPSHRSWISDKWAEFEQNNIRNIKIRQSWQLWQLWHFPIISLKGVLLPYLICFLSADRKGMEGCPETARVSPLAIFTACSIMHKTVRKTETDRMTVTQTDRHYLASNNVGSFCQEGICLAPRKLFTCRVVYPTSGWGCSTISAPLDKLIDEDKALPLPLSLGTMINVSFFFNALMLSGFFFQQGRIHDCSCRGRLGRGNNDLGRGGNDLGRGMLQYKLSNP